MKRTITELYRVYDLLNKKFFEGELKEPIILVVPARKEGVLGTCSRHPIWQKREDNNINKYEITISGEGLNRTTYEIVGTLLHEMVHQYCKQKMLKDVSGHVWHNELYKEEAFKRGLCVEKARGIGWSVTSLKVETRELVDTFNIDTTVFDYWRNPIIIKDTKVGPPWYKYTCPECGLTFSVPKQVDVVCEKCEKKMEIASC